MFKQLVSKIVITRKNHRCWGCLRSFPAGTQMESQTNVNEDGVYTVYTCSTCVAFIKQITPENQESEYPEGFCVEDSRDGYEAFRAQLETA